MPSPQVVLLRGVNVNGITVCSADLRACLPGIDGVTAAATVLASGNAVVRSSLDDVALRPACEAALREAFGYDAFVVVLAVDEVARIADACPYPADDAAAHTYVTFASDPAALDALLSAADDAGLVRLSPAAACWQAPVGSSTDTPLAKVVARRAFKKTTTTRNLRTLPKILAAATRL